MADPLRILCAGDEFIRPEAFVDALTVEIGDDHEFRTDRSRWPHEPFRNNDEVLEWGGDEATLTRLAADVDVLVTHIAPITEALLDQARNLRLVVTPRGGPVNVNIPAATARGVLVANVPGRNARAVAECTIGLLLGGRRRFYYGAAELRSGRWAGELYSFDEVGDEVVGRTVGLIGFGKVGSRVAQLLGSFGVRVLAYDPYVDVDVMTELGAVQVADLDDLLTASDVVSVHARLTDETRGLLDRAALGRLKPGAYLINTARGPIVDEAALLDALRSGALSGAALDVFDPEPPDLNSPLLQLPQVTALPHLAGASTDVAARAVRLAAAEVGRWVRGEPLANLMNPAAAPAKKSGNP